MVSDESRRTQHASVFPTRRISIARGYHTGNYWEVGRTASAVWLSEFRCEGTCCRRVDIAVTLYTCIQKVRGSKLDCVKGIPDTCITVTLRSPKRMSERNIEISVFIPDHFTLTLSGMESQKLDFWDSQHAVSINYIISPLLGPGLFISFVIFFTQAVGLLRRVISPSQGR
jgi:hypothetical protein